MAEFTVFDKLVSGLSSSERRDMLQRIASSVKVVDADTPLPDDRVVDLDESYRQMGLLRRLVVVLIAFFTGRERLSVVESYLLRDLGRRVNASLPHGFDSVQQQLRPGAVEDFRQLAESARRFSGVLGRVMGRERTAFVAFLAGLHAPEVQEQLVRDTDPFRIGAAQPELREGEVKRRALNEVEEAIATLSPKLRQRIYTDVRSLHQLMALSSFPFDRLISVFQPVTGGEAVPAPLSRIVDELARLSAVFEGLRQDPSGVLFEAFGLFQEQDRLEEDDESVERIVQQTVDSLSSAYARIREFAARYPLNDLVRIAHATHWRSFWRERVDAAHRRYAYQRRIDAILGTAQTALNLEAVEHFPGYPPSGLDKPARHGMSAGILRSVMSEVYEHEIVGPVGTLHREGEFYKSDNRADMDRAWHAVQRLATDVANLEVRLRPTGDLGMSWAQTEDASIPADAARERQLVLVATIDNEASALLHRATETFRLLGEILQGVLYGTVGGRYDTVSNLAELGGRNAAAFVKRLESAHVKCKAVAEVLSDLQNTETSIESS